MYNYFYNYRFIFSNLYFLFKHKILKFKIMRTSAIITKPIKKKIPKAIRQQVWLKYNGKIYENKCTIIWCQNIISVFNFHVGHNIPESKGGGIEIENLRPICPNCNLSMGSMYSIDEWNKICEKKESFCTRIMKYFLKN